MMLSRKKSLLNVVMVILLRLAAAAAERDTPSQLASATTDHFSSHVPLAWSGQYSKLPFKDRGSAIPLIPEGHRKFQFYIYGRSGQLIPTWLTLQQIQNILLSMDPKEELNHLIGLTAEPDAVTTVTPQAKDTVQHVIASVQQVISKEVAQNQDQIITPTTIADPHGQSLSLPEVILQNLMVLQQHTTPWQSSGTLQPTASPEIPLSVGLLESLNTESSIPEVTTTETDTSIGTNSMMFDPLDNIPAALRPLIDRWNSRFPSWESSKSENESNVDLDKNGETETTDDYHALPPSVSETVVPTDNEIHNDGTETILGANLKTTTQMEEEVKETTETTVGPALGVTMINNVSSSLLPTFVSSGVDSHSTTDEIVNGFYHTTLGNMYDNKSVNKNGADKGNSPIASTTTQETTPEETTTISHLQSAVINMATNLFETPSPAPITDNQQKDNADSRIPEVNNNITNKETTAPYNEENLSPLLIRDPLLPETVYDIQKVPDQPTTTLPSTEKPENPYDVQTTYLTVISPADYSTNSISTDTPVTSEQPSSLIDDLQNQGYMLHNPDDDMKPHYEFPVKAEDSSTDYNSKVNSSTHNESTEIQTTIQSLVNEMLNKLEVTTQYSTDSNIGWPSNGHSEALDPNSENLEATTMLWFNNNIKTKTPGQLNDLPEEEIPEVPTTFAPIKQEATTEHQTIVPHMSEIYSSTSPLSQVTLESHNTDYHAMDTTTQSPTKQTTIAQTLQAQELPRPSPFPEYTYYYYDEADRHKNVLHSSQLIHSNDQSRIDLEALRGDGNYTEGDYFYDYLDQPVYLDDVPKEYYDYDVEKEKPPTVNTTDDLGFPGPNATSPYHDDHHGSHHGDHHGSHHHGDHHGSHHGDHHDGHHHGDHHHDHQKIPSSSGNAAQLLEAPEGNPGLEATVENLDRDIRRFVDVINDITFKVYKQAAKQYKRKNFVMSPLSLISTLNILLLGARGSTSAALSDLLLIDQFYTFNPHLILKNVTDSILEMTDIHDVAFFKQFLVEKAATPYPLDFFSRTIDYFYGANITEMDPTNFDKEIRKIMNAVVDNATRGSVVDFISEEPLRLTPPLSAISTNFFHGRWSSAVTEADLFDMNFIRFPTAERRLIKTVGLKKKMTVNAGYSKEVGVTCAEIPYYSRSGELSLVLVMPGEQKNFVANGLAQMESTISSTKWSQILRSMLPNTVMFKMPVFRHRSFHNFSGILNNLGLEEMFKDTEADFSGINTVKSLHLSDVVQLTEFQSSQVEESRPVNSAASGRFKRSSRNGFLEEGLIEDNAYSVSNKVPTYIYGLPMTEYMRKNEGRKANNGDGLGRDSVQQNINSVSKATIQDQVSDVPFGGLNERGHLDMSLPVGGKKSSYRKVDTEDSPLTLTGYTEEAKEASLPSESNIQYPKDLGDIRYNRMGDPYHGPLESDSQRETAPYGAYYRQNAEGVLAFDRAFMYAVRHNPTGLLLFIGRYLDPEGK